jgi:ATP-dependent exoDNAse (exonuclease V) beta subunit
VLLRGNKEIGRILHGLRQQGLRASGEGGNELTDSDAVLVALSLLQLADHPSDRAAWFHVCHSPFGEHLGVEFTDRGQARELSRRLRRRLVERGYGEWIGELQREVVAVHDGYDGWNRSRFGQLVDMARRWDERASLRPQDFVRHVREKRVEDPTWAQIQVMTVHQAKGLEFDIVVLPELEGRLLSRPPRFYKRRPDPEGEITDVQLGITKDMALVDARMDSVYQAHRQRDCEEELCILYVAMTRARRRLDMIVKGNKPKKVPRSFAGIITSALGIELPGPDAVLWGHEDNAGDWIQPPPEILEGEGSRARPAPRTSAPQTSRRLQPVSPSSLAHGTRVRAEDLLSLSAGSRSRGTLIHRWLEGVEWLDDGLPLDDEWQRSAYERGDIDLGAEAVERAAGDLRRWLQAPAIDALLRRPTDGTGYDVWRERRFAFVDGEGHLVSGSFDRVVLKREGGRVVRADVYDYKTDASARDGGLEALKEHYTPQMEAYRQALRHLTGLGTDQIGAHLVFLAAGKVATLEPVRVC